MDIIHQGECGQDAKWSLTSENTLIISGEGRMKDYEIRSSYNDFGGEPFMNVINDDYLVPWKDYSNDITQIIIEEGITYIGSFAFYNFQSLESVILPHSLSEIGICSFAVCQNLYDIELNPQVKIAEWAFFGTPIVVTEEDTSIEIPPEILEELRERLAPKMEDYLNSIKKSSSHKNSDSPLIEEMYDIFISHLGIYGHRTEVYSDRLPMCYSESPIPNDMTKQQISESWNGFFFYEKAEDYFQSLFLDSYNKSKQLVNEEENNLVDIDNYYLSLLIKNALIKYQYDQNTIKLVNEVTEEDIKDYAERRKKELSLIASGIKEPPKSSIAFRLGRLNNFLENVLDRKKMLGALGFDNVEQVSNWLSSGIDSIDDDILCSDKITLNNLVKAYLDCQKRILYENDRTIIAMWYLISNCKLTNHDYKSVDESYIGELKIKHQWLVNNLSFDILYRMMFPATGYGCELDGWFNNVEVYLRKDVINDYPLSSLYVEDELLRGANIYINKLLKREGLGRYLYHEIYNDNKKNEILKYIGLSVEYEEGAQMVKGVDEGNKNAVGLEILNFKLKEPLNESELEKLYTSLVEEKFVSRESRIEDLSHVLGRPRPNDYKRIGWIKRNKNKTISKKSVLTFLRCLEVDWDDIEPKKLNYCFDTGKVPFKDNNLKDDKSFNCDKGKNANSEAVDDLYKVVNYN